ncbi:CESA [Mytilus edulis]|uniref:CESA n=1 Tax=Mytilus edulis TaxID=6550 RepID=A0A8S3RU81_MYTED|nr:CESA [Mytilus edulis]
MADNEVCAGCLRDDEEEIAVMWCNDCEEPVCRPCSKVHRSTNMQEIGKAETEESEVNLFHLVKHLDNSQLSNEKNLQDTVCTFDRYNALLVGKTSVFVIDLESKTIGRTIQLGIPIQGCKWITCIKSEIVVLCQKSTKQEKADFISWIDYNGVSLRTLDLPGNVCDLDIYETRVFCTFNNANHVTCTSFDGETNTCYTSLDLRESCKIAVGESMIFLLEKDRNSIYTIDIKTKQRSTFLKDEIINPTNMVLNRKTKELAVTCDGGNCLKIFNTHI